MVGETPVVATVPKLESGGQMLLGQFNFFVIQIKSKLRPCDGPVEGIACFKGQPIVDLYKGLFRGFYFFSRRCLFLKQHSLDIGKRLKLC